MTMHNLVRSTSFHTEVHGIFSTTSVTFVSSSYWAIFGGCWYPAANRFCWL